MTSQFSMEKRPAGWLRGSQTLCLATAEGAGVSPMPIRPPASPAGPMPDPSISALVRTEMWTLAEKAFFDR